MAAELFVDCLENEGVEFVFGYPGGAVLFIYDAIFKQKAFKHILVPIWLLTYTFGAKSFQVVANGYTGVLAGQYPKSPWKIAFVVLLALVALGILIASQN